MRKMRPRETLGWNKNASSKLGVKIREGLMDRLTRCPKCGKRMVAVVTISGRTDLQCISCDDPAVKWAESPRTAPEKPIVVEHI
jgi:tRNA(Ile2) C34 agmatinyltransferase TiaS